MRTERCNKFRNGIIVDVDLDFVQRSWREGSVSSAPASQYDLNVHVYQVDSPERRQRSPSRQERCTNQDRHQR